MRYQCPVDPRMLGMYACYVYIRQVKGQGWGKGKGRAKNDRGIRVATCVIGGRRGGSGSGSGSGLRDAG